MITILGAGAIGGLLAHCFLHTNQPIQLVSRTPFYGLTITTPDGQQHAHHLGTTSPEQCEHASWLCIATKAHQTHLLQDTLRHLVTPETIIFVFQNGVEHISRLRPLLPVDVPIFPAMIDAPTQRHDERQHRHVHIRRHPITIMSEHLTTRAFFNAIPEHIMTCQSTEDIHSALWRKLCLNVISGAIPTLTDQPGAIFQDEMIQTLCRELVKEAILVGRACGATLDDSLIEEIIEERRKSNPNTLTSMLQDRRAGKTLEADARNGAVCRFGKQHGIKTPYNHMATTLLQAINTTPSF